MNRGFQSRWKHSGVLNPKRISILRNELLISYVAVVVTLISFTLFVFEAADGVKGLYAGAEWRSAVELIVGNSLVVFFCFRELSTSSPGWDT